jgi:hypothetical protein
MEGIQQRMSGILFIRVSAVTYDEKDVLKAWPKLCAAVWPDPGVTDADSPAKIARTLVPAPGRGALELLDGFVEYVRFADAAKAVRAALEPCVKKLEGLRQELDAALGDRNVPEAHELTNLIEEALDETEKALREQQ